MITVLIHGLILLCVLALIFYIIKALIDFMQLSRDIANILGLLLVLIWIVWLLSALGIIPPLPAMGPVK